jgi:hypothetical protein
MGVASIDAEFARCSGELSFDAGTAERVVRFYPWWEHPQYPSAVQRGEADDFEVDVPEFVHE